MHKITIDAGFITSNRYKCVEFPALRNKFTKFYREKNSGPKFTGQGRAVKPR